jgi:hypothetical protein
MDIMIGFMILTNFLKYKVSRFTNCFTKMFIARFYGLIGFLIKFMFRLLYAYLSISAKILSGNLIIA